MRTIRLLAAAKVNLFLRVLGKDMTGYHQVETLYQSIDLCDGLSLERREEPGILLSLDTVRLPVGRDNLAYRAADLFLRAAAVTGGIEIAIEKRIPVGAGLGGGSADAGAVLRGMNILWDSPLSEEALLGLAGKLGADVPFALVGGTALAWGRGERMLRLRPLSALPLLLCLPDFPISTEWAYQEWDRSVGGALPPTAGCLDVADYYRIEGLARHMRNDFQELVESHHPEIARARQALLDAGASAALLSGTGSALVALFPSSKDRDRAEEALGGALPLPLRRAATGEAGVIIEGAS